MTRKVSGKQLQLIRSRKSNTQYDLLVSAVRFPVSSHTPSSYVIDVIEEGETPTHYFTRRLRLRNVTDVRAYLSQ